MKGTKGPFSIVGILECKSEYSKSKNSMNVLECLLVDFFHNFAERVFSLSFTNHNAAEYYLGTNLASYLQRHSRS